MRQKHRVPLTLEPLEDRWVPATVKFVGGTLFVSNPLITGGSASITLTQTANNTWQVMDGKSNLGTYATVGNINITGSNAKDNITFNLNGKAYTGNLFVNAGNGNDSVSLNGGGVMAGNATVLTGNGNDTVSAFTNANTTMSGNLQIINTLGGDTAVIGNGADTFGGDVTVTGVQGILLSTDTIDGNLTLNSQSVAGGVGFLLDPTVGKNFTLNAGNSGTNTILFGGTIGGNAALNLGNANNNFLNVAPTTIGGNLTLQSGSGTDTISIAAADTIQGNAQINLGDGSNSFSVTAALTAQGNLSYLAGNGPNLVTLPTTASVGGNLSFQLGNGNDTVTAANSVAGTTQWQSGNGADSFALGSAANNYNVNVHFGNNDDTFAQATTGLITGLVDGGGRLIANQFIQNGATLGSPFVLQNFP